MLRVIGLVASLTFISKILGLIRDLVIAHYFGTSVYSDAFNLAYLFTGNIFIIFGCIGGPIYNSVVAILPKVKRSTQKPFLKKILWQSMYIFTAVALIIYFAKPYILNAFIDKSKHLEYFNLTLTNIDLLLILILITGPNAIIGALLNIYKKYFMSSISPAITNITLIIAVMLSNASLFGMSLALGTTVGGLIALFIQWPAFKKIMDKGNKSIKIDKREIHDFNLILYPALLSTGFAQIMTFVDGFFCRGLEEGSWTAVTLSSRLIQMPMGILITAVIVPFFPKISVLVKQQKFDEIKRRLLKLNLNLVLVCIPAVVIGCIWHEEIIRIIFERGAFNARSTEMVSSLFYYFSLGAIPYVLKEFLVRTFYSFGDSRTPLYVMVVTILLKAGLNYTLIPVMGLKALAFSMMVLNIISFLALLVFFIIRFRKVRGAVKSLNQNPEKLL